MSQTNEAQRQGEASVGAPPKRAYRPPTLKAIGSVRELTAKIGSANDDNLVTGHTRKGT